MWSADARDGPNPSGAGDARLRRCDRPRSARHSTRPAGRRIRIRHLRRDRGSPAGASDARLPRAHRLQPPRPVAAASLLAGVQGVADGIRTPRSDGADLPQHHAAGVFHRRASHAGAPVLSRQARAQGLRRSVRPGDGRLGIQPAGSRRARLSAHGGTAGRAGFLPPQSTAESLRRRTVRRWVDQHPLRGPGDLEQEGRGSHLVFSCISHGPQPALSPAHRRHAQRLRAVLRRPDRACRDAGPLARPLHRPGVGRGAGRVLRNRRSVSVRQRA